LTVPPVDYQRRVADVLSAYDDLIENNRRRMELLEEAARQLYREWFVRLRFPGREHTRIINGVPEGWCNEKVGNILAKIEGKKKIPKENYLPEGPIPCVDQSAEFIGGFTDDEDAVYAQPLPIIVFGDHTRILKFVNFPFARGADGTQIIYSNIDRISSEYLYLSLKEIDLSNYFYARHFKFLKEKELLLPDASLIREFSAFARPCFQQIQTLRLQNQKLRTARDLLLPRLMSGEIPV
jgi:type I restriction enzyme S subunit